MAVFRSKSFKASFDPAFDDLDLAEARDELAQGRWEPTRDLLEDTRRNWDRRAHRIRVLADAVAAAAWVERWQALDPGNADAAALRAQIEVVRLVRSRGSQVRETGSGKTEREVEELCRLASTLAPKDPVPWISLVTLSRAQSGLSRDGFWTRWQEMRNRDSWSRDGAHQTLIYLFGAWRGSHAEMYDFAYWLAGEAPEGSPLAVLPLVAHAESYRVRAADGRADSRAGLDYHWSGQQVNTDLDRILERWFLRTAASPAHAQAKADLNYLAHALIYADRHSDARPVMKAIGAHVTRLPWAYTGDPESTFAYWRNRLLS
jgi:hypothetical protein